MKTTLVVLAVLAVVGGGTVALVDHFGGWTTLIGKGWAITYEVSAQPAETAVDVSYAESPDRYRKEVPRTVSLSAPLPWSIEVVVNAGEKAAVSAVPKGEQVLSCRILLDGVRELAGATGEPGQRVSCEATTAS